MDNKESFYYKRFGRPSGKYLGKDLNLRAIYPNNALNPLTQMMYEPLLDAIRDSSKQADLALSGLNHEAAAASAKEGIQKVYQELRTARQQGGGIHNIAPVVTKTLKKLDSTDKLTE